MILLDTHIVLWRRSGDRRLGPNTRARIEHLLSRGEVYVCAITFWEVAMRVRKGHITDFVGGVGEWRREILAAGLIELPLDGIIAAQAGLLPDLHGDPADRIIVATALAGGHELITADRQILAWSGPLHATPARP